MGRAKDLLQEALKLDPTEQEELLEGLWVSTTGGRLDSAQEVEIERRIDELDAGTGETVEGDDLMSRLRQRYRAP
jgi:putative addiction module component (TIGR02574 family)